MVSFFRYLFISVTTLALLFILTALLLPILINFPAKLPELESSISQYTGRQFTFGEDFSISFFPWLNVSGSNLSLSNPSGFISEDFLTVGSFEARVKVLPLLRGRVECSRFVVGGVELHLETNKAGEKNWIVELDKQKRSGDLMQRVWYMPTEVEIDLLAVTDGKLFWKDRKKQIFHEVEDLMLLFKDLRQGKEVDVDAKITLDKIPILAQGQVGPLSFGSGNDQVAVKLTLNGLAESEIELQGKVFPKLSNLRYEMDATVPQLSMQSLLGAVEDTQAQNPLLTEQLTDLKFGLRGTLNAVSIDGVGKFSDTNLTYRFDYIDKAVTNLYLRLGKLDLAKYIQQSPLPQDEESLPTGYRFKPASPLDMRVEGTVVIDDLKLKELKLTDVETAIKLDRRVLGFENGSAQAFGGQLDATLSIDLTRQSAQSSLQLSGNELDAAPAIQALFGSDFLTGKLGGDMVAYFIGNDLSSMISSLNGSGTLQVNDGTISGLKLAADTPDPPPSGDDTVSDFFNIDSTVSLSNGVISSKETALNLVDGSYALDGEVDLVYKTLALKLQPLEQDQSLVDNAGPSPLIKLTGPMTGPEIVYKDGSPDKEKLKAAIVVSNIVDEKLPSPKEEDVKDLVGKTLVDPAVVASRFRLQPLAIKNEKKKIRFGLGTGKIQLRTLVTEDSFY